MSKVHPSVSAASAWTVWKSSSMAFHGTDGFSVFDKQGKLVFRVDNYARKSNCDLVLMDGDGRALLTLRPQIMSPHHRWKCLEGDGGSRELFSMKRRRVLQSSDEAKVFTGEAHGPVYRVEGCFKRRSCKVREARTGEVVAEIKRKMATSSVVLGEDVFCLIVHPHFSSDVKMFVGIVIVMDRICRKHRVPLLCS